MRLSENIYRLRTAQNMSQLDLADALEVSRQSVSKWETGTAVPELEKLVKIAKLFDVSLDELVYGEAVQPKEEPAQQSEPKVIYIEKPVFREVKRESIIGGAILVCALIYALILYEGLSMEETLSLVFPVAALGIVYLLAKHPLFWCGWISVYAYWMHFFIFFPRWEQHPLRILLGVALPGGMVLKTIHVVQKGIVKIPGWVLVAGSIVLLLLLLLLIVNTCPFF